MLIIAVKHKKSGFFLKKDTGFFYVVQLIDDGIFTYNKCDI